MLKSKRLLSITNPGLPITPLRGWNPVLRRICLSLCAAMVLCAAGAPALQDEASSSGTLGGTVPDTPRKEADAEAEGRRNLFVAAEFPKGWVFYSAEKGAVLGETWKIEPAANEQDAVLVCLGKPFGYIRTEESFENFEFQFEWKYPKDANANSGILIYTNGPDMIWPQAVQVQLHGPSAGSVFPGGGAKTENTVTVTDAKLAVNEWHRCVVTSRDGTVTVVINDRKMAEVTGCIPRKGGISIQSEGSEIHFRRIQLRALSR